MSLYVFPYKDVYGLADRNGNVVFQPQFNSCYWFGNRFYFGGQSGQGTISRSGTIRRFRGLDALCPFSEGFAPVKIGGLWGFIGRRYHIVIEPWFDKVTGFSGGVAAASLKGKWGFINPSGQWIVPPHYDDMRAAIAETSSGKWIGAFDLTLYSFLGKEAVAVREGNVWRFIHSDGTSALRGNFEDAQAFRFGAAIAKQGGKYGLLNTKGTWVFPAVADEIQYDVGENIAAVRVGDKFGYINSSGRTIFPIAFLCKREEDQILPLIEYANPFHEGYTVIEQDGHPLILCKTGETVSLPRGIEVGIFEGGLARARQDGKWGVLDSQGKWVVSPQYDTLDDFENGIAFVSTAGRYGLIDAQNHCAFRPLLRLEACSYMLPDDETHVFEIY